MAENEDVIGFEGMPWLPAHVVDEACHHQQKAQFRYPRNRQHRPMPTPQNYSRCSSLRSPRTGHPTSCTAAVAGGPGMQAIFLDSGRSCSGTGVFLPRRAGTDFQYASNKHVRPPPPVLLPDRVVQALKLNVHELGSQIIKPSRENGKNLKRHKDCNFACNKKKASDCYPPEIFLPKEWTY